MRSSRSNPVSLSSSYLTLEPIGISMTAVNLPGKSLPGVTSCQGWVIVGLRGQGSGFLALVSHKEQLRSWCGFELCRACRAAQVVADPQSVACQLVNCQDGFSHIGTFHASDVHR